MRAAERGRKRIYRIVVGGLVFSNHETYDSALKKAEKLKKQKIVRQETPVHIQRWSAKYGTWEAS